MSRPSLAGPAARHAVTRQLQRAAWLGVGALVAIVATVVALTWAETSSQGRLDHSRSVARLARRAFRLAVEEETSVRAYLVTRDQRSLDIERAAEQQIGPTLDSLHALTAGDAQQQARVVALRQALGDWVDRFEQPVIHAGTLAAAPDSMARALAGKPLFDAVREQSEALTNYEDTLYAERLAHVRSLHLLAALAVAVEGLLILVVLSRFGQQSIRQARDLEDQQQALETQAIELEEQTAQLQEQTTKLEQSGAELEAALESAPIGFAFFDKDLRFVRVNSFIARINDRPIAEHLGATLADVDPALAERIEPFLRQVLATCEPMLNVSFRTDLPGTHGAARNWISNYYPVITATGEVIGVGAAVTDVTALKQLEEQLLQAQKMEAVGRLAGGVAHDFNNLLTVINGYAQLLLADPALSRVYNEIEEIRAAGTRAAKLTRQLLAFSRRQALQPRIVDPNDVLRGVETLLRRLVVGNIRLVTKLSPDVASIRVDPGQLEQVVMNLAINAADAMPNGGELIIDTANVELDEAFVHRDPDIAAGLYTAIRVSDTGQGMSEETQARIFEPFFTTKEAGRGTGLGLSTVYGIVKQSGGYIDVKSAPGAGSVFSVYLPAVEAEAAAAH